MADIREEEEISAEETVLSGDHPETGGTAEPSAGMAGGQQADIEETAGGSQSAGAYGKPDDSQAAGASEEMDGSQAAGTSGEMDSSQAADADSSEEAQAAQEIASDEAQSQNGTKDSTKKKKKFLKDKRDEKIAELNDRLLRNMAEFENFRNRSEKEKAAMFEIGAKSVIEKILPVVDNFERGLAAVTEEEREQGFVKGMEAVYKQFTTVLGEIGVTPIEAVGKEFDPNLHNAVMHDEDDSMEPNTVSEELQKGYMYKDSVVRHSMVKVVN